jgi:hypothetical protein
MIRSRLYFWIFVAIASIGLIGEVAARYIFGLGSPPIYVADSLTEYRLKPSQSLRRFGNRIDVNQFSMRSAPLVQKRSGEKRRLLVFGDSVVWGGAVLDQDLIATDLLGQIGTFEVGNVAAPSWGPGNWLGYVNRFGFFDATDVVLVISSHDAADNPSPEPFQGDDSRPLQHPPSALWEGMQRYLLPRFGIRIPQTPRSISIAQADDPPSEPTSANDPRVQQALSDLREFLKLAAASGARVVVVQFADREEARSGELQAGNRWIQQVLDQEGIPSIQAGPIFRSCGTIDSLYSDVIHPYTAQGQACLAKAIQQALMLESRSLPATLMPR